MMAEQDEFYDSHATLCASSQFPYNIIDFASNNKCKLQITDNLYRLFVLFEYTHSTSQIKMLIDVNDQT